MDYAQARLQARFGERPGEPLWQQLEQAPDAAAVLAVARRSPLRRWVAGLAPDADRHAIEIALRAHWRECVCETAAWMPESWRPAVLWARTLVDMPALSHLARGGAPSAWMDRDPLLQAFAAADAAPLPALLRDAGCDLLSAPPRTAPADRTMPSHWLAQWRLRWPRWSDGTALDALAGLLQASMRQPAATGRPLLEIELRRLFRRSVLAPAAAFAYLAFAALDLVRLRAALLRPVMAQEGLA